MSYSPIAILGYAQTSFGELWDVSLTDLLQSAATKAIENSGLKPQQIDAIYVANMASGNYEFQMHLNSLVSSFFPHHPPSFRLEAACASGGLAIVAASHALQSGAYKHILVIGAEKMTDVETGKATKILSGAANVTTEYGSTFPALYALLARLYCSRYKINPHDLRTALSLISSRAHDSALSNKYAQFQKAISPETITASPFIADPLRIFDCSPLSDGAAAIVLALDSDKKLYPSLPHLISSGHAQDSLDLVSRSNLPHLTATQVATKQAFAKTDLTRKDISVIELHDCFTIAEILAIEDMGFVEYGTAIARLLKDGYYRKDLTINPSGGLKACGHPVGATGIKQIGVVCKHLKLKGALSRFGLTQNVGGTGGTVIIHLIEGGQL